MNDDQKTQALKEYFTKREDVLMAFLFGSRAKGHARATSDWDVGVYLTTEDRAKEQELWGAVEEIVRTEVDLVVLNRAPAIISWNIVRTGVPLIIRNRHQYLRFLLQASHEANAWYHTSHDYYRVFERSASLTQEDRVRLEKIVQFFELEVADYPKFQQFTWEQYETDRPKKREIERWAEQIMNAVIDTAEIVLASERHVIPETYKMMVQSIGILSPFNQEDVCARLAKWTDLRNILAHEYLDYRWKEIGEFLQESGPYIQKFIVALKTFLEKAPPAP